MLVVLLVLLVVVRGGVELAGPAGAAVVAAVELVRPTAVASKDPRLPRDRRIEGSSCASAAADDENDSLSGRRSGTTVVGDALVGALAAPLPA